MAARGPLIRWRGRDVNGNDVDVEYEQGGPKRLAIYHPVDPVSMTKQEFGETADINYIMQQWKVGIQPMRNAMQAMYGEFDGIEDYHSSVNKLMKMDEAFMTLSPYVRDLCGNDPGKFLQMLESEEGLSALRKAGLLPEQEPKVTSVKDEPAASEPGTVG